MVQPSYDLVVGRPGTGYSIASLSASLSHLSLSLSVRSQSADHSASSRREGESAFAADRRGIEARQISRNVCAEGRDS